MNAHDIPGYSETPQSLLGALELVLSHVDVPVFATEIGGDAIVFANPYFEERYGKSGMGVPVSAVFDLPPGAVTDALDKGYETYCEKTCDWILLTASDVTGREGAGLRLFTCHIVTAKKLLAEVKKDADKLRDSFLDEARSEISVPLKGISGISDLIMHEYITPQVRNHAFRIKHAASTLLAAINDLIAVGGGETLSPDIGVSPLTPAAQPETEAGSLARVKGLDVNLGRENMSGSDRLYRQILTQYCAVAPVLCKEIQKSMEERDLHNLVIHLHSLKSSTASIGAVALSYRAARLERGGRDADWAMLEADLGLFMNDWQTLVERISEALAEEGSAVGGHDKGNTVFLKKMMYVVKTALGNLESSTADKILDNLKQFVWNDAITRQLDFLADDILLSDFDQARKRADEIAGMADAG